MEDTCPVYNQQEIAATESEMATYLAQRDREYELSMSAYSWEAGTSWRDDPMGARWKEQKKLSCVLFHRLLELGELYAADNNNDSFSRKVCDLENIIDSLKVTLQAMGCKMNMAFPTSEPELWIAHGSGRFLSNA